MNSAVVRGVRRERHGLVQRAAIVPDEVTALPVDAHSAKIRSYGCPAARFATLICKLSRQQGVSLYVVQGLLGHSLVRTTQRYAHLANDTLADAAEMIRGAIAPPGEAEIALDGQPFGQRPQTGQTL